MSYFIGPYKIVNPLFAAGGQSRVVTGVRDGNTYAIKLLDADPCDEAALARFDLEADFLRTIDHPNIVRYVDDGVDGEIRYIAMPKLPGRNLRFELADRRRLEPSLVAHIARQIATALQVFHQLGAVYRDMKPENIQFDAATEHAWLLDAGYARYVKRTRITLPGGPLPGTEGYRAPESLTGHDYKQSDFFALGVVLYELVTGRHPFHGREAHRGESFPPVNYLVSDCPKFLVNGITFLMAWDVRDRPQDAAEVLRLLEDPRHGLHSAQRPEIPWAADERVPLVLRLLRSNISSIARATENGYVPDALLVTTNTAELVTPPIQELIGGQSDLIVDPEVHQTAFAGYESLPGFASLICKEFGERPLTIDDLNSPEVTSMVARLSLDAQASLGGSLPLVPGYVITNGSPEGWLSTNAGILDAFVDALPGGSPFATRVLVSLEAISGAITRKRFLECITRHHGDLFLLSFDGLGPNASAEQLLRALETATLLQGEGSRCVICDSGAFSALWYAYGFGVCFDLVAEAELTTRPHTWTGQRFDFPSLLTSLRLEDAEKVLSVGGVAEAACPCFACSSTTSIGERLALAGSHNAAMAFAEREGAARIPPSRRPQALRERVGAASRAEMRLRRGAWELRLARLQALHDALDRAPARLRILAA